MSKITKLPSGAWHTTVYSHTIKENGKEKKKYESITADTKAEVEYRVAEFKRNKKIKKKHPEQMTVKQAIKKYIALSGLLSPTTLHSYETILEHGFQNIMDIPVADLDDEVMQLAINEEAKRKNRDGKTISAKTVKNEWGLVSAALNSVCKMRFNIKLPKIQHHYKQYPEPKDVINAIKGSDIELPCLLAMWLSFSLSEIRGLKCSDIKDGYITINRVMVDVGTAATVKDNAKVETRLRRHKIPPYLKKLIESGEIYQDWQKSHTDGYLVPKTRNMIYGRWQTICKEHNLELSFHDLRHMNASIMLALNVPEKYAMERGGWSTPDVLKSVYQHTFSEERKIVDATVDSYFDKLLEG